MNKNINNLTIVGTGPSGTEYVCPLAYDEIKSADIIAGANKIVDRFAFLNKQVIIYDLNFESWISKIKQKIKNNKVVIVVSGDPGFYSISKKIIKYFEPDIPKTIPGISSIQLACALSGKSWNNLKTYSLHGRKAGICEILKSGEEFCILIDRDFESKNICKHLADLDQSNRVVNIFSDLGSPESKYLKIQAKEIADKVISSNSVLLFERFDPDKKKFFGIGVGIGGFEMLTVKAINILRNADKIYAPKSKISSCSMAYKSVKDFLENDAEIIELEFNMDRNKTCRSDYYKDLSESIATEIKKGFKVAFITIGDPLIYSTYNYLLKNLKKKISADLIETVPGISSYTFAMSCKNETIIKENEKLAVLPCSKDMDDYSMYLQCFDTIVFMKIGKNLKKVIELIEKSGRKDKALFFKNMGSPGEIMGISLDEIDIDENGYFSVIVVRR